MRVDQAIILGAVQGLTEFLPISSSAHLIFVPWLLGWEESGLTFDVALHLGTLVAVLGYFRRDLLAIAWAVLRGIRRGQPFDDPLSRLGYVIVLGSIPAAVAGFLAQDPIDRFFHAGAGGDRAIVIIAALMIGLGATLWLAERLAQHRRPFVSIGGYDGLIVGAAQAFALLPGVSRSGGTITAALFVGLKRDAAARFSFLLGVPAIVGAGALELRTLFDTGLAADDRAAFAAGVVTAAVVGYLAIAFLLRYLRTRTTLVFTVYRFGVGLVLLVAVAAGFR